MQFLNDMAVVLRCLHIPESFEAITEHYSYFRPSGSEKEPRFCMLNEYLTWHQEKHCFKGKVNMTPQNLKVKTPGM